ncbi:MAG: hypothetical protein J5545_11270 [Bacteroidaceae bacterium]|nr:hypothetical protein [Bacteroidaceae bacterium]
MPHDFAEIYPEVGTITSCYEDGVRIYHNGEDYVNPPSTQMIVRHQYKPGADKSLCASRVWGEYNADQVWHVNIEDSKTPYSVRYTRWNEKDGMTDVTSSLKGNIFYESYGLYEGGGLITLENDHEVFTAAMGWPWRAADYYPFVQKGKRWHMHGFNLGTAHTVFDYFFGTEEVEKNGKYYLVLYLKNNDDVTEVGLFRESDRRIYKYDAQRDDDVLAYDFSVKEGDCFDLQADEGADKGTIIHCLVTGLGQKFVNGYCLRTVILQMSSGTERWEDEWIEGIGTDNGPLSGFEAPRVNSWGYYLAYVIRNDSDGFDYFPLSFNILFRGWRGQGLEKGKESSSASKISALNYELVNDQLHISGEMRMPTSPNNYLYCVEGDNHQLTLNVEAVEPVKNNHKRYQVDLYFPFFDEAADYTVVDDAGEHTVRNRNRLPENYRPMAVEGKVWNIRQSFSFCELARPITYYIKGDTVINDLGYKKLFLRQSDFTMYLGALREQYCRTYFCPVGKQTERVLFDFSWKEGQRFEYNWSYYTIQGEPYTITTDQRPLACLDITHNQDRYRWMAGVGGSADFFMDPLPWFTYRGLGTVTSCYENGTRIYHNGEDTPELVMKRMDLTHTFLTADSAKASSEFWVEYNEQVISVYAKSVTDAFTISLTEESGKENMLNGYFTGTGFMDYARDHRFITLTIKSDNELFTGTFDPIEGDFYQPFIEEGKVWTSAVEIPDDQPWSGRFMEYDYFDGDTIVAGKPCKIWRQLYVNHQTKEEHLYTMAAYEEDGKVWFFHAGDTNPRLAYDFKAKIGQTVVCSSTDARLFDYIRNHPDYGLDYFNEHCRDSLYIFDTGVNTMYGHERNVVKFKIKREWYNSYESSYIEGLGSPVCPSANSGQNQGRRNNLLACTVQDQLVFFQESVVYNWQSLMPLQTKDYHPFVQDNKVWKVCNKRDNAERSVVENYYFDGETVVGNQTCKRWMCDRMDIHSKQTSFIGLVYEKDKQVWFAEPGSATFHLIYDFAVTTGDTIAIFDNSEEKRGDWIATIARRTLFVNNGRLQNAIYLDWKDKGKKMLNNYWVEGVGALRPPHVTTCLFTDYDTLATIHCSVDSIILYRENYQDLISPLYEHDYRPIIEEGKVWVTRVGSGQDDWKRYEYRQFGDTVIDGKTCKVLGRSELDSGHTPIDTVIVGALYEEGGRVYGATAGMEHLELLYDFESPVGTNLRMQEKNVQILGKERGMIENFKGLCTSFLYTGTSEMHHSCWMEGVGFFSNPLMNLPGLHDPEVGNEILLYCYFFDEVLYMASADILEEEQGVKKQWLDFTHTTKPRPKAPTRRDGKSQMANVKADDTEVEAVSGAYSERELFVNLKPLSGSYTVTLTDGAGQTVYQKVVQTSDIVALNTDLTQYAEGTYSLTVENSEEQFTASLTLPLNVDAVRNLPSARPEGALSSERTLNFTDLSGRRLSVPTASSVRSVLPKGIYIQNGKKLIIK